MKRTIDAPDKCVIVMYYDGEKQYGGCIPIDDLLKEEWLWDSLLVSIKSKLKPVSEI